VYAYKKTWIENVFLSQRKMVRKKNNVSGVEDELGYCFDWLFVFALLSHYSAAGPDVPLPWYARRLLRKVNA
jgi:hypothetical protein